MGNTTIDGSAVSVAAATTSSTPLWLTYQDCLEHINLFSQHAPIGIPTQTQRAAILAAYEEVIQAREWSFMQYIHRIPVTAAQTTGTIDYTHSTRIAELTGDTFSTSVDGDGWAMYLDDVLCGIEARLSSTQVRLDSIMNPGEDVSEGTYTLFQRYFPLPNDFLSTADPAGESFSILGREVAWQDLSTLHRWNTQTGTFRRWCIGPDPSGGDALYIYPPLDTAVRLDLPIKKRPRELKRTGFATADCAGTTSVSGAAVTGSGTSFTDAMVGSILRISSDDTQPDGRGGDHEFFEEREIDTVTDSTTLTLKASATTASDVAYRVTDPLSVGRHVWDAVLKAARKQLGEMANLKNQKELDRAAFRALQQARGADAKEQPRRVAFGDFTRPYRLADSYVPD